MLEQCLSIQNARKLIIELSELSLSEINQKLLSSSLLIPNNFTIPLYGALISVLPFDKLSTLVQEKLIILGKEIVNDLEALKALLFQYPSCVCLFYGDHNLKFLIETGWDMLKLFEVIFRDTAEQIIESYSDQELNLMNYHEVVIEYIKKFAFSREIETKLSNIKKAEPSYHGPMEEKLKYDSPTHTSGPVVLEGESEYNVKTQLMKNSHGVFKALNNDKYIFSDSLFSLFSNDELKASLNAYQAMVVSSRRPSFAKRLYALFTKEDYSALIKNFGTNQFINAFPFALPLILENDELFNIFMKSFTCLDAIAVSFCAWAHLIEDGKKEPENFFNFSDFYRFCISPFIQFDDHRLEKIVHLLEQSKKPEAYLVCGMLLAGELDSENMDVLSNLKINSNSHEYRAAMKRVSDAIGFIAKAWLLEPRLRTASEAIISQIKLRWGFRKDIQKLINYFEIKTGKILDERVFFQYGSMFKHTSLSYLVEIPRTYFTLIPNMGNRH